MTRVLNANPKSPMPSRVPAVRARSRLLAQPFDARTLQDKGEAVQVLDDVLYSRGDSYAGFSLAEHGEMAYQTTAAVPRSTLAWFNRAAGGLNHRAAFRTSRSPRSPRTASVWR